jgi:iron complex transport system substrate-binding protein
MRMSHPSGASVPSWRGPISALAGVAGDNGAVRIISLLPSGSEIVHALGLGDLLVGRSHACDYPGEVLALPAVTSADRSGSHVDVERIAELRPDFVIADGSDTAGEARCQWVRDALRARSVPASVVGLEPRSLEGTFNSIISVGAFAEAEDEAIGLVELMREQLGALENGLLERRLLGIPSRRVAVLTSLEPLTSVGRWVPELVRRAGGWELLGRELEDAETLPWLRLREVDPEVIVLALDVTAAGSARAFDLAVSEGAIPTWFDDLGAVRDGELFAVSAALILRPGPRVIEGIAMLAELFDPEGFAGAGPDGAWIPLSPVGIGPGGTRPT